MTEPRFSKDAVPGCDAISDFLDYMRFEREASPNTVRAYGTDLLDWAAFCDGEGKPRYPVTNELLARYLKRLEANGLSSGTRMRKAAVLSAFSKYLLYDGKIESAKPLGPLPKREKTLPQIMTEGEIERILSGCESSALPDEGSTPRDEKKSIKKAALGSRDRTMIEMAYDCGLRASELCSMRI